MSCIKRMIDDVYADYEDGMSVKELCEKHQITEDVVRTIISLMNKEEES